MKCCLISVFFTFYFRSTKRADRRGSQGAALLYLTQAAHSAAKTCRGRQHLWQCQHRPFLLRAGGRCWRGEWGQQQFRIFWRRILKFLHKHWKHSLTLYAVWLKKLLNKIISKSHFKSELLCLFFFFSYTNMFSFSSDLDNRRLYITHEPLSPLWQRHS